MRVFELLGDYQFRLSARRFVQELFEGVDLGREAFKRYHAELEAEAARTAPAAAGEVPAAAAAEPLSAPPPASSGDEGSGGAGGAPGGVLLLPPLPGALGPAPPAPAPAQPVRAKRLPVPADATEAFGAGGPEQPPGERHAGPRVVRGGF